MKPRVWWSRGQRVWVATFYRPGYREHLWCRTWREAMRLALTRTMVQA